MGSIPTMGTKFMSDTKITASDRLTDTEYKKLLNEFELTNRITLGSILVEQLFVELVEYRNRKHLLVLQEQANFPDHRLHQNPEHDMGQ